MYTLIVTAKLNNVDPRAWLANVLARIGDHPASRLDELLPWTIRVHAADALLRRPGRAVDAATADPTEHSVAAASVEVAEALSSEASLHVANKLFELADARSTLDQNGFDRHWRNARTHTLHDPVRYKRVAVGAYYLNDTLPSRHGALLIRQ